MASCLGHPQHYAARTLFGLMHAAGQASPSPPDAQSVAGPGHRDGDWLDRIPIYAVPLGLGGLLAGLGVAAILWPTAVVDEWLWRYFWGPVVADARGFAPSESLEWHGVPAHAGYNPVNTVAWALLLGLCILWLAQILRRYHAPMDMAMIAGATLWVAAGTLFHLLEDTMYFRPPVQYLFISPAVYLVFGALGVLSYLMGHRMRRLSGNRRVVLAPLGIVCVAVVLGYAVLAWSAWDGVARYAHPFWVALAAAAVFLAIRQHATRRGAVDPATVLQATAIGVAAVGALLLVQFASNPWSPHLEMKPWAVAVPTLAVAGTALAYSVGRVASPRWPLARALVQPVNLLLVGSQLLDAFATALAIDGAGYEEKHVVSLGIISGFAQLAATQGWTWASGHEALLAFVPLKFTFAVAAVVAMDAKKRMGEPDTPYMGLIKFAIILGGIGPGLRDFVRLGLGV